MLNSFTYNDILSTDYNAYVFGGGTYHTPERNYESIQVDGRNGNVLFDRGNWRNVDLEYSVVIMHDFSQSFLKMKADLMSLNVGRYYVIKDTFHPTKYRMGVLRRISKPKMAVDYDAGVFTVMFECKPQIYDALESAVVVSDFGSILNNTGYTSFPLITVEGDGSFMIGSNSVVVSEHQGTIIYDTEINEAYGVNGENMNQYLTVETDVPYIPSGEVEIVAEGVTLSIEPRLFTV